MNSDHKDDDVVSLFSRARVKPYKYQQFPATLQIRAKAHEASKASPELMPESIVASEPALNSTAEPAAEGNRTGKEPASWQGFPWPEPVYPRVHPSPDLSRKVTPRVVPGSPRRSEPSVLPVLSLAGGTGTTTVLATLGRAMSCLGERVLLSDDFGSPMLPLYFGCQPGQTGVLAVPASVNRFDGDMWLLQANVDGDGPEEAAAWIFQSFSLMNRQVDRILVHPSPSLTEQLGNRLWLDGECLVVVTPELRCILAIEKLTRVLAERQQAVGSPIAARFILNRFDESNPLEQKMRDRLEKQLGERLLPFFIPAAPEVAEAFAEGTSVMDYAPGSNVAKAFLDLAQYFHPNTPSLPLSGETQAIQEQQRISAWQ